MKLVGTFRGVVCDVSKGKNQNKKDVIKVVFDVTDEKINGEWVPMERPTKVTKWWSLGLAKNKSGKAPAEFTAEQLKDAFNYTGGLSNLGDLIFKVAHLVCEDTGPDQKFTQIQYVNNPDKPLGDQFEEFSDSVTAELERIFKSIA
jgi:hypothetical protein